MYTKNDYCSYCGHIFIESLKWPRTCNHCKNISFINPLPVTVSMVPVGLGLVVIRRGIEPCKGELAFPGGYLDVGETWQEGAVRELKEEIGLKISPNEVTLQHIASSHEENTLLIFCKTKEVSEKELFENFSINEETTELFVVREPIELAFPTHTQALSDYLWNFKRRLSSVLA